MVASGVPVSWVGLLIGFSSLPRNVRSTTSSQHRQQGGSPLQFRNNQLDVSKGLLLIPQLSCALTAEIYARVQSTCESPQLLMTVLCSSLYRSSHLTGHQQVNSQSEKSLPKFLEWFFIPNRCFIGKCDGTANRQGILSASGDGARPKLELFHCAGKDLFC
jgi:hypothetical protein